MTVKKPLLEALGARFRALRKAARYSQQQLSARAKVSRDTIHRLEHGSVVDTSSLTRLLAAMGHQVSFEKMPALRAADVRRLFPEVHAEGDL